MRISTISAAVQAALLFALATFAGSASAQDQRVYDEGQVLEVTSVQITPGQFDAYMAYLAGPFRQQNEELKKAGVIVDYGIYQASPRHPGDADLYLTIVYPNMAALDGLEDKSEPSMRKIYGTRQQASKGMADRESMRTILGSELIRQLKLK